MLSYQAINYYRFVSSKLDELEKAINLLIDFSNEYNTIIEENLKKIEKSEVTTSGSNVHYIIPGGKLKEKFRDVIINFKGQFDILNAFMVFSAAKQQINDYLKENQIEDYSIEQLFVQVKNIFELYQKFLQTNNEMSKAIEFGQSVSEFVGIFKTTKTIYKSFEDIICYNVNKNVDNKLEIQLLNTEYTFEEFTYKLTKINELYCNLGNIVCENKKYEKLRIIKIESGSLLSIILGDKNVLASIANLLDNTINLIFHKYTTEGKLYRNKQFMDALKEEVTVKEKMEKLGYKLDGTNEDLEKTFAMISKNLLEIVEGTSNIKINDKEYKLNDNISDKYIQETKKLMLNSGIDKRSETGD